MQATVRDGAVTELDWPEDGDQLGILRRVGAPRLLLVRPGVRPPAVTSALEDWVRLPADRVDVKTRVETLAARAAAQRNDGPGVDSTDLVHFRGEWAELSEIEAALTRTLVARLGEVVSYDELARAERGAPRRATLRVQLTRLRARLAPLGLDVHSVRARGYVLRGTVGASSRPASRSPS
jgi:hypothetical protein